MEIETALQQYLTSLKESEPRERVELDLAVLARLQEYLEGDASLGAAEAIRAADLRGFIRAWYRDGEGVTPTAAKKLVRAVLGWAEWLERHRGNAVPSSSSSLPGSLSLAAALASLEESLPRATQAAELLRIHARREDLSEPIPVEDAPGGSPLGTITGGVTRVMRPAEVDYSRAEEDTYAVAGLEERALSLRSPTREQLGEGAAWVLVPHRVARLLRIGDILHAEIAPTAAGWEILNVETLYPGDLNDRP